MSRPRVSRSLAGSCWPCQGPLSGWSLFASAVAKHTSSQVSPLCFSLPLPPFSLPCSPCPALVDGFESPAPQMGSSWSLPRLLILSTLTLLSAQIQAWELVT